jgi:hypothetical protein
VGDRVYVTLKADIVMKARPYRQGSEDEKEKVSPAFFGRPRLTLREADFDDCDLDFDGSEWVLVIYRFLYDFMKKEYPGTKLLLLQSQIFIPIFKTMISLMSPTCYYPSLCFCMSALWRELVVVEARSDGVRGRTWHCWKGEGLRLGQMWVALGKKMVWILDTIGYEHTLSDYSPLHSSTVN